MATAKTPANKIVMSNVTGKMAVKPLTPAKKAAVVKKALTAPPKEAVKAAVKAQSRIDKNKVAVANQVAEAVIASEQAKKPKGPQLPMVYRDGTHSAIVLEIGAKAVTLITMASLKIEEMRIHEFESSFEPYPEYPVARCAEIYLKSGQYRLIDEQTRERLLSITGGKLPANMKTFAQQPKEIEMPSTARAPAHPLRRASDAPIREALKAAGVTAPVSDKPTSAGGKAAATKPTDKPAPAKKAAESKEAKAPPAKKTAEKPAAKTAPAAKKAPWDKKDGAKADAKPAAKTAPAAKKTAPPSRTPKFGPETKVTMGDTAKAKRGRMLTYIEKAIELAKKGRGQTTRGAIDGALKDSWEGDENDLRTYFGYAVKNGLLVAA